MIRFKRSWREHRNGDTIRLSDELENRLVQIGKAEKVQAPKIDHANKLSAEGLHTPEQILAADLTLIKGIGKATEERIKQQIRNVYNWF